MLIQYSCDKRNRVVVAVVLTDFAVLFMTVGYGHPWVSYKVKSRAIFIMEI